MRITTISGPAVEPFELSEAKELLRIPAADSAEDDTLTMAIAAARRLAEHETGSTLLTKRLSWEMTSDEADPTGAVRIPLGPVSALVSLTVYDGEDLATVYSVNGDGNLEDADGEVIGELVGDDLLVPRNDGWDAPGREHKGAVLVYDAGWGASSASLPEDLRAACGVVLADLWEHRESAIVGTIVAPVSVTARRALWPYKRGVQV